MSIPPRPLPAGLGADFTRAEALELGVDPCRLNTADLERICHGIYRRVKARAAEARKQEQSGPPARQANADEAAARGRPVRWRPPITDKAEWRTDQVERARALARHLPQHCFFSGPTAAALWGLPTFGVHSPDLEVASISPKRALRRRGITGRCVSPELAGRALLNGIPVSDVPTTWVMYGSRLSIENVIALGDAAIRLPRIAGTTRLSSRPHAEWIELKTALARGRRPGIARLREALPRLSRSSASVPESHLRILLESWDFPEPELDYDVRERGGGFIGCSEFAFPRYRLAMEYEGEQHLRDSKQWNRDIEKYRRYTEAGWEVIRVTAHLLYRDQRRLHRQLDEALRRRAP